MVTVADTSFLFSVYGNDVHTGRALNWLSRHPYPLTLSVLNEFELGNALRFSEFKSFLPEGKAEEYWQDFQDDKRQGRLQLERCNLAYVLEQAMRISERYTLKGGHRSFDILHVSTAVVCEASTFLTFDQNQTLLARNLGLVVPEEFGS